MELKWYMRKYLTQKGSNEGIEGKKRHTVYKANRKMAHINLISNHKM